MQTLINCSIISDMNRKMLIFSLLIAFFMGVISLCPCPAMAFSAKTGPHKCCDQTGKCPSRDCQTSGMTSLLSISEKISHEVSPNPLVVVKIVPKIIEGLRPVEVSTPSPPPALQLPSLDIPITYSTILI